MKLVRLDVKAANASGDQVGLDVVIHPQITMVVGAPADVRHTLIEALAGIPRGTAATGGVIEVDGAEQDLSTETLARLGLATDLDIVVRADDLPRDETTRKQSESVVASKARDKARSDLVHVESVARQAAEERAASEAALEALRAGEEQETSALEAAAVARAEAAAALAAASAELAGVDQEIERLRAERDAATEDRSAAEQAVADAAPPEVPNQDERLRMIEARREDIKNRLLALVAHDPAPVQASIDRIDRVRDTEPVPIPAALAFADAWRDLHEQLTELERAETDEERAARTRLDAARLAAVEAEQDLRVSGLAPDLVAELEAAHNEVLDAQDRTNSRFSGTRARTRLDEARAAERKVLDRLGFTTYADYMMSSSSRGAEAGKRAVLQAARVHVAEAETEWHSLGGDPSREVWRADLLEQRSAIAPRIALLLGHEPVGPEVEQELRALRAVPPADEALLTELRTALTGVGLDVSDEELGEDELLELGRAWIDENAQLDDRRAALEGELSAVEVELTGDGPADGESRDPSEDAREKAQLQLVQVQRRLDEAEAAIVDADNRRTQLLASEVLAREQVAALDGSENGSEESVTAPLADAEARFERAGEAVAAAELEVERVRGELTAAEDRLTAAIAAEEAEEPAEEVSTDREELLEEIEWYLLTRLAAQRSVGDAGPVPLVLDDAFRDLDVAEAVRVMESIERVSAAVQVIAVTDDLALSFWAEALGANRAAVVSLRT